MANKAFLLPIVIDDTRDDDENVPDKFREVQWTRLPGGDTPLVFVERVRRLLSPESSHAEPTGSADSAVASAPTAPRGLLRRTTGVLYGAIAATVLVLAVGYFALERGNRSMPGVPGAASIAVLPLANESGEASQQYFSDGISEDLITALSQFPGLKVPARRSSGGTGVCTQSAYNRARMKAVFIELPAFERHRTDYLDDDAFSRLQDVLMDNPEAGEVIEGTGGLRKVRFADSRRAKGKRGGLRVIYYYWTGGPEFWLFTLYDKDEMADLSPRQRAELKERVKSELKMRRKR